LVTPPAARLLGMVEQELLLSGDVWVLAGHFLRPIEDYLADENGLTLLLPALLRTK
jgi:hypothetical protein